MIENYNLDVKFVFIPVIIIILFSFLKIDVKISMGVSIIFSFFIALFFQKESIIKVLKYMIFGFDRFKGSELETIIKDGTNHEEFHGINVLTNTAVFSKSSANFILGISFSSYIFSITCSVIIIAAV